MSDLFPVAGAKIYIGGAKASQVADFVVGDFSGETWVEIDGWTNMGGYGDTSELITTQVINRGRDVKQKGTKNAGSMANQFAEIAGDAGQAALIAAQAASGNYAFRIVFDDSLGTNGTTIYFVGLVMSWAMSGGSANTVRMRDATIEINSNIPETAAA